MGAHAQAEGTTDGFALRRGLMHGGVLPSTFIVGALEGSGAKKNKKCMWVDETVECSRLLSFVLGKSSSA